MRKCNICGSNRPEVWYKTKNKKTCRSCERGWKGFYYRYLVQLEKFWSTKTTYIVSENDNTHLD